MTLPLAEQSPEAPGSPTEVWEAVQELVKPDLSDGSYRMWFAGVEATAIDGTTLQLEAPSDYVRNWLVTHYMDVLTSSARSVIGPHAAVHIHVSPSSTDEESEQPAGTERRRGRRAARTPDPAQAT